MARLTTALGAGTSRGRALFSPLLLVSLFAIPAQAASLVDLRVGGHPNYTRVVFELDANTPYRIDRPEPDLLVVTIEAGTNGREIRPPPGSITSVLLMPGAGSRAVARIRLANGASSVTKQVLNNPLRIVVDVSNESAPTEPDRPWLATPEEPREP